MLLLFQLTFILLKDDSTWTVNTCHVFSQQPLAGLNGAFCVYWSLIYVTDGQAKELPTYKDNDFINDGQKIFIDEENKKMFLEKLRKDVEVCLLIREGWSHSLQLFLDRSD